MQPNTTSREGQALTISVDEAAKLIGVSRGLAYIGVHDGSIPAVFIGGRILIPRARFFEMFGVTDEPGEGG